jgi:hypothetical protein
LDGFSAPEPHGRWTDGREASFACRIGAVEGKKFFRVQIDTIGFVSRDHTQRVSISVNGEKPVDYLYEAGRERRMIELPLSVQASRDIRIGFTFPDAVSPKELGLSADPRKLGISVKSIRFE